MNSSAPAAAIAKLDSAPNDEHRTRGNDLEPCPICGQTGAKNYLRAPDRFHGRLQYYPLVRCTRCSLVWLSNPPRAEEMHHHYTGYYHGYISAAGETSLGRWCDRGTALKQYKQTGALLDLGCSSGSFLEFLKGEAWTLHGIELSLEEAKIAQARSGATIFGGDILDAPFPPKSFDVITGFDVLEHLHEPRRVMARVGEWLKPGGIFYVLVPNIESAEARVFGTYWQGLELPRHLFHYSPASLKFLAESAGLRQLSLETRRNPTVGTSLRYVWDDLFRAVGIQRTPTAYRGEASFLWRAARKVVRMSILQLLLTMAPLAGGGEAIHAIFRKEDTSA